MHTLNKVVKQLECQESTLETMERKMASTSSSSSKSSCSKKPPAIVKVKRKKFHVMVIPYSAVHNFHIFCRLIPSAKIKLVNVGIICVCLLYIVWQIHEMYYAKKFLGRSGKKCGPQKTVAIYMVYINCTFQCFPIKWYYEHIHSYNVFKSCHACLHLVGNKEDLCSLA